ncbi:hypothetical protein AB0D97_32185 [Streptomyces roseus]|uniref:hypothetical protein n=1 Tax=Streptomyces roseus TaxID=66430 RepID=UPI0033FBE25E
MLLRATGVPNAYGSGKRRAEPGQVSAQEIAELLDSFALDDDDVLDVDVDVDVDVDEAFAERAGEVNNRGLTDQVE